VIHSGQSQEKTIANVIATKMQLKMMKKSATKVSRLTAAVVFWNVLKRSAGKRVNEKRHVIYSFSFFTTFKPGGKVAEQGKLPAARATRRTTQRCRQC